MKLSFRLSFSDPVMIRLLKLFVFMNRLAVQDHWGIFVKWTSVKEVTWYFTLSLITVFVEGKKYLQRYACLRATEKWNCLPHRLSIGHLWGKITMEYMAPSGCRIMQSSYTKWNIIITCKLIIDLFSASLSSYNLRNLDFSIARFCTVRFGKHFRYSGLLLYTVLTRTQLSAFKTSIS